MNRLVALPMVSFGMGDILMVVSGTKTRPSESPISNCGQKKSQ